MKFFETVKKIDCILVLLVFCLSVAFFVYFFVVEIFGTRPRNTRPQVQVVTTENEKSPIIETTDYVEKIRDVFVFAVKSNSIKTSDSIDIIADTEDAETSYSSGNLIANKIKGGNADTIVNIIFLKENGEETKLFSENVFIFRHSFERTDYNEETRKNEVLFPKNVFAVIENDANKDGKLNTDDFVSLFVSDYDGNNLKKLAGNICFARIDKNALIFADYKDGEKTYYVYDADKNDTKKIKSVKENVTEKEIYLW